MTTISEEELEKLMHLCRIACSSEEKEVLKRHLSKMLVHMEELNNIDTQHVAPCLHVLASHQNVMREDVEGELLPREVYLANVSSHVGGMIRVPPILKE
jgi:aspartyl-tRNA(Asn)/glutamyl-tRNA(Gln) amidotransferase subunit C